ncbi:Zinc finger BED domain-containing protein 4 [Larimichthys crocea]|uniref:Zinc finger BED domain-containing protein 4 n=1 Tax=Larimichthys crocea TaxID=215358 RepID=A0A6G0HIV0_LARCR|nr:Zinc finger BED domain-containing protein 4 [Larimichthys crocea]
MENEVAIEDAPATFKSPVWRHFGFPIVDINGGRVADKTQTICKHCKRTLPYTAANTSNMQSHMQRHHSELQLAVPGKRVTLLKGQATLTSAFGPKLLPSSARATAITRDIGIFMAVDMRPFSVVENEGFRRLLHTLEPKYTIPSRVHFSRTVLPKLYEESKATVVQTLKEAETIAITTDGWSSRNTQRYITVTAHVINNDWEMKSVALQTRPLFESHTGLNIAEVLTAAVTEWELQRANHGIAIVTDNAHNMDVAVREAGLELHIKCFAHTINLATQAGLRVVRISRLLGRVRRVAAFFHRSTTAAAVLTSKQKQLQLPPHKLIMDVITRWNSSLDMLERYLEQQEAIAASLASPQIKHNARDIDTLDSSHIRVAEDLVKLLKPLKTATTVLCDEKTPTVSLIVPLKSMIQQSMAPNEDDSTAIANTKSAILNNISGRYSEDVYHCLLECTALDPRFRALPQLDHGQREAVFLRVQDKAKQLEQNQITDEETGARGAAGEDPTDKEQGAARAELQVEEPSSKRTALEDLLGDSFSAEPADQSIQGVEREIDMYKREASIPLTSCPLKWWRDNRSQYPLLSQLAKAYLSIPATPVPSERVFSTAGDIVTAQRSQLLPENVDILIFLKKNMSIS